MRLSEVLQNQAAFVEDTLGESVICDRCRATVKTFSEACTADLQEACPGFLAIEQAKGNFAKSLRRKEQTQ